MATSVNLRFCIGCLQKISIKANLVPIFVEQGMIEFIIQKLEEHYSSPSHPNGVNNVTYERNGQQHTFFLDYSTAMLANILHARSTQDWLQKNPAVLVDLTNRLIVAINQPKIPTSTLIHLLIAISYLNKYENLRKIVESPEVQFSDKMSKFVEKISKQPLTAKNINDRNVEIPSN